MSNVVTTGDACECGGADCFGIIGGTAGIAGGIAGARTGCSDAWRGGSDDAVIIIVIVVLADGGTIA